MKSLERLDWLDWLPNTKPLIIMVILSVILKRSEESHNFLRLQTLRFLTSLPMTSHFGGHSERSEESRE